MRYKINILVFIVYLLFIMSNNLYAQIAIPQKDRPSSEEAKALSGCISVNFYYGIGMPKDPVKARHCAYLEMEKEDCGFLGGTALLAMIYANGVGVERNLDLAIEFASEFNGVGSEMVSQLEKFKEENWQGNNFNACDYQTSRCERTICASLKEDIDELKRQEKLSVLKKTWSIKDLQALEALETVLKAFISARTENEVDCSGTGAAIFVIEEAANLRDDFLTSLEGLEQGQFPHFSLERFKETDRKLNSVYKKIGKDFSVGTLTFKGIRATQRVWLVYRDAWVIFGKQRYPHVTAESWKAWLTEKRINMLNEFVY